MAASRPSKPGGGASRMKETLLGTLNIMARQNTQASTPTVKVFVSETLSFLQILSFPLSHIDTGSWASELNSPISDTSLPEFLTPAFWLALSWTVGFLAIAAVVTYNFATERPQSAFLLHLLKESAWLSTGIFFLPFTQLILYSLKCTGDGWVGSSSSCWSGDHLFVAFLSVIVLAVFSAFSLLVAVTVNIKPGKLHGRNDLVMLSMSLLLGVYYTLLNESETSLVPPLLVTAVGATWMLMYLFYPATEWIYGVHLHVMSGGIFLWASICAIFAVAGEGDSAPTLFYSGAVLAAIASVGISHMRFTQLFQARMRTDWAATHPVLAHAWAHYWMTTNLVRLLDPPKHAGLGQKWTAPSAPAGESASVMSGSTANGPPRTCPVASTAKPDDEGNKPPVNGNDDLQKALRLQGMATSSKRNRLRNIPMVQSIMENLQHHEDASPMALYIVSRYHATVTKNRFLEVSILRRITMLNPPFDLQFVVYSRLRQHQEATSSSSMRGIDRVLFDQHRERSGKQMLQCYTSRLQMWEHLLSPQPDVAVLVEKGYQLQIAMEAVVKHLHAMMTLNPQSIEVLESLAAYHREFDHDLEKVEKYLATSRRVQEHRARHKGTVVKNVRLGMYSETEANIMDDDAVVIQISVDPESVGELLTVTGATMRLFGRHPSSLVGGNVSSIMPSPFSEIHDTCLLRYVATGKYSFINETRVVFALGPGHTLMPVWLTLREAPPLPGDTRPVIAGIMQPLNAGENHLLVTSRDTGYRVLSACAQSQGLLGMDGDTIAEDMPSLGRWIPDFANGTIMPSTSSDEVFETTVTDQNVEPGMPGSETVHIKYSYQTASFAGAETVFLICWKYNTETGTRSMQGRLAGKPAGFRGPPPRRLSPINRTRNGVDGPGAGAGGGGHAGAGAAAHVGDGASSATFFDDNSALVVGRAVQSALGALDSSSPRGGKSLSKSPEHSLAPVQAGCPHSAAAIQYSAELNRPPDSPGDRSLVVGSDSGTGCREGADDESPVATKKRRKSLVGFSIPSLDSDDASSKPGAGPPSPGRNPLKTKGSILKSGGGAGAAGSVASSAFQRRATELVAGLRLLRSSKPNEVSQIKKFFLLILLLIVGYAVGFGLVLDGMVGKSGRGVSLLQRNDRLSLDLHDLQTEGEMTLLSGLGWPVYTDRFGGLMPPAERYGASLDEYRVSFEGVANSISKDWEEVHDAWALPNVEVYESAAAAPTNRTALAATRTAERFAFNILSAIESGTLTCPSTSSALLNDLLENIHDKLNLIPLLHTLDSISHEDDFLKTIELVALTMAGVLCLLIVALVVPVLRRLERRTSKLLLLFVKLPSSSLRMLFSHAETQLADLTGAAEEAGNFDDMDSLSGFSGDMSEGRSPHDKDSDSPKPFAARSGAKPFLTKGTSGKVHPVGMVQQSFSNKVRARRSSKTEETRKHANSWRFVSVAVAKFLIPLVAIACWVALILFLSSSYLDVMRQDKMVARQSARYSASLIRLRANAVQALLVGGDKADRLMAAATADFEAVSNDVENLLRFGGKPTELEGRLAELPTESMEKTLLFIDACGHGVLPSEQLTGTCREELRLGAVIAAHKSLEVITDLHALMKNSTATEGCRGPVFASAADRDQAMALLQDYLEISEDVISTFGTVTHSFLDDIESQSSAFRLQYRSVISLFVVVFALLLVHLTVTTVSEVTRVLHLTVTLLLMLPEHVLTGNDEILASVMELVQTGRGGANMKGSGQTKSMSGSTRDLSS